MHMVVQLQVRACVCACMCVCVCMCVCMHVYVCVCVPLLERFDLLTVLPMTTLARVSQEKGQATVVIEWKIYQVTTACNHLSQANTCTPARPLVLTRYSLLPL